MPLRPLRRILSVQTTMVLLIPFVVAGIGVAALLYPSIKEDIYLHQQQIAVTVASRIGSYLEDAKSTVRGVALFKTNGRPDWHTMQQIVDAQIAASETLRIIYVLDKPGKVKAVGLKTGTEAQRQDLLELDLSRNPAIPRLSEHNATIWSDSFLSVVGGGLSVAIAASSEDMMAVGEVQIHRLSAFLRQVGDLGQESIFILDRYGNLVADDRGRYTAQQLNLSNLPLVRRGMEGIAMHSGNITLAGREMIGCYVPIPAIGWGVLVTQPVNVAYHTLWTTIGGISVGAVFALLVGIALSMRMARKLAGRFEQLATHARQIADGKTDVDWPESSIFEISELTADLQQMARKIGEREQQLDTLMRNIPGLVYRCAHEGDWTFSFVSEGSRQLTGYGPSDLLGNSRISYNETIHADDRDRVWAEILAALDEHEPYSLQYRIVTAQGKEKTVLEHGQGLLDPKGEVVAIEGIITDISEQVHLEQQLRHSQKMESIGQLAGGVAHDFNNMLTAIIGAAELMMMELKEGDPLRKLVETITSAATKSAQLVRKLLLFSRKATHNMQQIDLHRVLSETIGMLERSIDKRIEVVTNLAAADSRIIGDAGQLDNMFLNMLLNARDAMPNGGILRVASRLCAVDEHFARQIGFAVKPGSYVEVAISDTGTGMTPEILAHIFEPFFTTKEVGKGTGLGLAAAYGTVKEHGGTIQVYSEPGQGSTFKILLPLGIGAVPQTAAQFPAEIPRGKAILLVEDEELLRQVGNAMLRDMGCKVLLASDGKEGVEIFAEHSDEIDLVMLDVVMPTVNGRDAFRLMKEIDPGVRVLFLSGYADSSVEDLMNDISVTGFLQKPYRLEELTLALSRAFSIERGTR
ncbi:blue-light-activated protein [Geobacter sp. OR-1]|uniref:ATP-binding protein n=1 Tax=Geobacter sp. OR-1 TaxID=1266765 RepID=UPI000542DFE6|nr:ATP-binding protein [Geobacter sp. OR-1]GAM11667.1 blue-light-activated protein [Geobacter sp. OR-1]